MGSLSINRGSQKLQESLLRLDQGLFSTSYEVLQNRQLSYTSCEGLFDIGLFFDFSGDSSNVSQEDFYIIRLRLRELRDEEVSTSQAT